MDAKKFIDLVSSPPVAGFFVFSPPYPHIRRCIGVYNARVNFLGYMFGCVLESEFS